MEAMKIKSILFSLMLVNLIKKKNSKFSYCYAGLDAGCSTEEAIDSFFCRAL